MLRIAFIIDISDIRKHDCNLTHDSLNVVLFPPVYIHKNYYKGA